MFDISQSMIVDVDINLAAALLMVGVWIMTLRRRSTGEKADSMFLYVIVSALIETVAGLVVEFFEGPVGHGPYALVVILETILEYSITTELFFLLLYVFLTMHDSMDYLKRRMKFYMIPFVILTVVTIVNMFTGIIWYYDENLVYNETILYFFYDVIRYTYLVIAIYQYANYKKQNGVRFFSMWTFMIPIMWGTLLEWITDCAGFTLGNAIAVAMLFVMSSQKVSFTDEKSGFYNIHYLNMLRENIKEGKYEPSLVINYKLPKGKDLSGFFNELREILPDECDTIKIDDTNFVTVIYGSTRGLMNMLSDDIQMIAEALNMDIKYDYAIKKKEESPVEFFEDAVGVK